MPETKKSGSLLPSCSNSVDSISAVCCKDSSRLSKNGRTKYGSQRFLCRICNKTRVHLAASKGYGDRFNERIVQLTKEGLGIRSTARVLGIAPSTVLNKILSIAVNIQKPEIPSGLKFVQVDEIHTYVQQKKESIYIIYSWSQELRRVLSLAVGRRSRVNLKQVVDPLLRSGAQKINTDRYSGYKGVVPVKTHTTLKRRNNGIERNNLTMRTRLKRLNRRTLCYSKSSVVLFAVISIYCWY